MFKQKCNKELYYFFRFYCLQQKFKSIVFKIKSEIFRVSIPEHNIIFFLTDLVRILYPSFFRISTLLLQTTFALDNLDISSDIWIKIDVSTKHSDVEFKQTWNVMFCFHSA
jgi:hypothetical protein